jgi:hypothetical protein
MNPETAVQLRHSVISGHARIKQVSHVTAVHYEPSTPQTQSTYYSPCPASLQPSLGTLTKD